MYAIRSYYAAFDVSAACSGFVYALDAAVRRIEAGVSKKALVIGAEVLSRIVDWEDRNTCILFGDGAGAVVLTAVITSYSIHYTKLYEHSRPSHKRQRRP